MEKLCVHADTCVGQGEGPNQNIVHIQWNYFSQNASGMQTQMTSFKQLHVNLDWNLGRRKGTSWSLGDGKSQKLVTAALSTSYIPSSLELIATVEM